MMIAMEALSWGDHCLHGGASVAQPGAHGQL
jgi:hypothetical protein